MILKPHADEALEEEMGGGASIDQKTRKATSSSEMQAIWGRRAGTFLNRSKISDKNRVKKRQKGWEGTSLEGRTRAEVVTWTVIPRKGRQEVREKKRGEGGRSKENSTRDHRRGTQELYQRQRGTCKRVATREASTLELLGCEKKPPFQKHGKDIDWV